MNPTTDRNSSATAAPAEGRDWDPAAALKRLAGDDIDGFTARLYRAAEAYARAPAGHLSFEEMQGVVAGDPELITKHAEHLEACGYCAGLRATHTPSEEEKHAYSELVKRYERPSPKGTPERPAPRPVEPARLRWGSPLPAWGAALAAAAVVGGLGLSFFAGSAFQRAQTPEPTFIAYDHVYPAPPPNVADMKPDWAGVRQNCTEQSGQKQGCDLLAAAAELQVANGTKKSQAAAPVVVAALQSSGVSPSVVGHVKSALDTHTATDVHVRDLAKKDIETTLAAAQNDPAVYLQLAKLRFQTGDSVHGFESLSQYVASDNAAAGKALQIGFVEPVRVADQHRRTYEVIPQSQTTYPGASPAPTAEPAQAVAAPAAEAAMSAAASSENGRHP